MKRIIGAAVIALAGIFVAGCGSGITSGTVIAKQDTPGHDTTVMVPQYRQQCTEQEEPVGSNGQEEPEQACTQVVSYYLPMQQWVPEDWQLQVRSGKRTGWVDVGQSVYQKERVGQHWSASS